MIKTQDREPRDLSDYPIIIDKAIAPDLISLNRFDEKDQKRPGAIASPKERRQALFLKHYFANNWNATKACEKANISRTIFHIWKKNDVAFQELLTVSRESQIDLVEDRLLDLVKTGNFLAICFWLKTQARSRGYAPDRALPSIQINQRNITNILTTKQIDQLVYANEGSQEIPEHWNIPERDRILLAKTKASKMNTTPPAEQ